MTISSIRESLRLSFVFPDTWDWEKGLSGGKIGKLVSKSRLLDGSRKRERRYLRCPRLFKNRSAFVHGSARRKNIVDEHHAPIHHISWLSERKSAGYIPYPLRPCQFDLRSGRPGPEKVITGERDAVRFAHPVRKKKRLIEAPLSQSFGMERDGHD